MAGARRVSAARKAAWQWCARAVKCAGAVCVQCSVRSSARGSARGVAARAAAKSGAQQRNGVAWRACACVARGAGETNCLSQVMLCKGQVKEEPVPNH